MKPDYSCTEDRLIEQNNALQATITLGINPGYFHNNDKNSDEEFYDEFQVVTEHYAKCTGVYIAFVIIPATCMYKQEWGCPKNGEKVYYLQATMNPKFNPDKAKWKQDVIDIIKFLKEHFMQSTVTITFTEAQVEYLV
jgi:hypothetical protein